MLYSFKLSFREAVEEDIHSRKTSSGEMALKLKYQTWRIKKEYRVGSEFEEMVETTTNVFYLLSISSCSYEKSASLLMNLNVKTHQLPSLISCFEWTAHFFIANRLISLRSFTIITSHLIKVTSICTNTKILLIPQISAFFVMFLVNRKC